MTLSIKTNDYQEFLAELSSFTSVDSRILDNLIKLKLIDSIFNNPEYITISHDYFSFTYYISLKNNYENIPEYIFASYTIHNNKLEVLPYNKDFHIYHYQLINYNKEQPFILYFKKYEESIYIDINFNIKPKSFSDLNVDLLYPNEFLNLQNYIMSEFRNDEINLLIHSIYLNSKTESFLYIMTLEIHDFNKLNYDKLSRFISDGTIRYFSLTEHIKNLKKDEIDKFFEPAFLRKELNNF